MPSVQFLTEAIDEEEGIIDGDADADQRDDVGRIDRDIGYVRQPNRHANGGQNGADAHAHREECGNEGSEHDAQNQQGERARDQFGFDEVVFDAVVKSPVNGDAVGHPSVKATFQIHAVVKVVHDGLGFFSVGVEDDLVKGVLSVFVARHHVFAVHFFSVPGIFNRHVGMIFKISEGGPHCFLPCLTGVVQFTVEYKVSKRRSTALVFA